MSTLFEQHIQTLQQRYATILDQHGFDALVIDAGRTRAHFLDDTHAPFRANPHFLAWVPLSERPNSLLLIRPGQRPQLFLHQPTDFWHLTPALPEEDWSRCFELRPFSEHNALGQALSGLGRLAWIGEDEALARRWDIEAINPPALLAALHYQRARKTAHEQHCLAEANRIAVRGHRAAEQCFRDGGSEFDIQLAYLAATGHREADLPYDNIIALNHHGATLHYQFLDRQPPQTRHSLLIDAGARYQGYAADITRTYAATGGLFAELIAALDALQLRLAEQVRPGLDFIALHRQCHVELAGLLAETGLVRASVEEQIERGITRAFFPHGLGHLLGLQVHDVAGWQQDEQGRLRQPPAEHPFLRLTRVLEADQVLTLEPGLYFIPALLTALDSAAQALLDRDLIERLLPCGGIRIEDNLLVTASGHHNLTRHAFTN